jgi:hypothetical protein
MAGLKKKRKAPKASNAAKPTADQAEPQSAANYPRHSIDRALRIPLAILDQNAGKPCTEAEAAGLLKVAATGPFRVEISSGIKYGLLQRPVRGKVEVTDLARKVLRPQQPQDKIDGLRQAVSNAPLISDVYAHYRGENLPDAAFFHNALVDKFHVPKDDVSKFETIFRESLTAAQLLEEHDGRARVIDAAVAPSDGESSKRLKKLGKEANVTPGDTCFVMMPFAPPLGGYYSAVFEPAILKAGLTPLRADDELFGTGKIIDQIWRGINGSKVLVAELTNRNPNVFYELGLAHALNKPVVLVSSNETDVPFDLRHIRVIYYDVKDPFWGTKLIEKLAENIISAVKNPEEAVFKKALSEGE